jgi:hypothetical protein
VSPAPAATVIEDNGSACLLSDQGGIVSRMSIDDDYFNPINWIVQIGKS